MNRLVTSIALIALVALAAATVSSAGNSPLKVYILAGQSNMQGQANVSVLPSMADDPTTRTLYNKIVDGTGKPRVYKDVHIAAFSKSGGWGKEKIDKQKHGPLTVGFGGDLTGKRGPVVGPELAFGITMYEDLQEPILLIKTSWGGKSLCVDFRPPSAGPHEYPPETEKKFEKQGSDALKKKTSEAEEKAGHYYRLMIKHIQTVLSDPGKYCSSYNPKQGYEIAGFVWFQGFNDMVNKDCYPRKGEADQYAAYTDLLSCFIRDVRKELNAPYMPYVIGVIGTGGNSSENSVFREAMAAPAALPEFESNVVAVHTAQFWDDKLGELVDRGWRWEKPKYDPENKYTELREKLLPLQKEQDAIKKINDTRERGRKHKELKARMNAIMYTPEEQAYLKKNKSSQPFHYNGSAKTYNRIGEAFAKALIQELPSSALIPARGATPKRQETTRSGKE